MERSCERKNKERGPNRRKRKGRSLWSNLQRESRKTSQQLKLVLKTFWNQTGYFQKNVC